MTSFSDHVRQGDRQMQAVHQVLTDVSHQNATVHKAFQGRDDIFQTHLHYKNKVERLQEQLGKQPQNSRLAEKLNRNVLKKNDHQVEFQEAMNEVNKSVSTVLEQKQSRIAEAIAKMCQYQAVVFEAAARLVKDFAEVGEMLVLQSSSEAHMRKGQQLAAQAQHKLSNFASGGVHTAASAGGTDGYPVDGRRTSGGNGGGYGPGGGASASGGAGDSATSRRRGAAKAQEGAPFMSAGGSSSYAAYAAGDSAGGPSSAGWTNSVPVNSWPGNSGAEHSAPPWGQACAQACAQHAFSAKGGAAPVAQAVAVQAMRDPWGAQTAPTRSVPAARTPWA